MSAEGSNWHPPASGPSPAGLSSPFPKTSFCATWYPRTLPGFQSQVKEALKFGAVLPWLRAGKGTWEEHRCVEPLCSLALFLTANHVVLLLLALCLVSGCCQPDLCSLPLSPKRQISSMMTSWHLGWLHGLETSVVTQHLSTAGSCKGCHVLKILITLEQGASHFHFALGPTN